MLLKLKFHMVKWYKWAYFLQYFLFITSIFIAPVIDHEVSIYVIVFWTVLQIFSEYIQLRTDFDYLNFWNIFDLIRIVCQVGFLIAKYK
jgi:hypothetical protein